MGTFQSIVEALADCWDKTTHRLRVDIGSVGTVTVSPEVEIKNDAGNPIPVSAVAGPTTDRSGAITTGGTAQDAAVANTSRHYLFLRNPTTEVEPLYFDLGVNAVVTGSPSIRLDPGDQAVYEGSWVPSDRISVNAATSGHKWTCKEG